MKGSAVSYSHRMSDIRNMKLYNTLDHRRDDFKKYEYISSRSSGK